MIEGEGMPPHFFVASSTSARDDPCVRCGQPFEDPLHLRPLDVPGETVEEDEARAAVG